MDCAVIKVDAIEEHPNADKLEIIRLKGFQAVFGKGKLRVGQHVLYIMTDAKLNLDMPWTSPIKTYVSQTGRVRTVKLRGEFSEGIIIPLEPDLAFVTGEVDGKLIAYSGSEIMIMSPEDIAKALGITHYEEPMRGSTGDLQARSGGLPYGIPKTDQENVQNIDRDKILGKRYLVTRKKDGSSCTITFAPNENEVDVHVTSRSLDLKIDADNVYTRAAKPVIDYVLKHFANCIFKCDEIMVLRGEVTASNIQRKQINIDAVGDPRFWCFEAFSMNKNGGAIAVSERKYFQFDTDFGVIHSMPDLNLVPVIGVIESLTEKDIDKYLNAPASDGEGVVLWEIAPGQASFIESPTGFSFKIRSKEYDSKMK